MQKNIRLAIPTMCHEKWDSFTKTAQGGFCSSCQKEVIDFTGWGEDRLKAYFVKPSANACGRFKQEQLKVYTFEKSPPSRINWLAFTLVSIFFSFSSRQTSASTVSKIKQHVEQLLPVITMSEPVAIRNDSSIVVRGKVNYAGDRSTLPGVNVTCKRTANSTVTDADGNFTLKLKSSSLSDTLVFTFISLQTVERPVDKNEINEMRIEMTDDITVLSGTVGTIVAGGIVSAPWYSPRRWWWGVKRCFRN